MPNNFTYTTGVPNPPNRPAADVPLMQVNTNSISSLINIDHVGFNTNGSGIHKQVTLLNQSAPGLGDGDGVLYAKVSNSNSWPVWKNLLGNTALMTFQANSTATGYTPLPGGLLLQYGNATTTGTDTTVTFGTPFTLNGVGKPALSVVCTNASSLASNALFSVSSVNANGADFVFRRTGVSNFSFYWLAIGTKT